jgi:hypothetical protein
MHAAQTHGKLLDMPAKPKDAATKFRKPPGANELKPPDGQMKLSNSTLQEALDSAYATFAACLGGLGYPPSKKFFEEDIPSMIFELAVGAGWLELTEAALLPDEIVWAGIRHQEPVYQGRKLVLFGDLMIDTWYKEAFLALLGDQIASYSYDPPDAPDRQGTQAVSPTPVLTAVKGTVGGRGHELIDEYFHLSNDMFKHFELAQKASERRRKIDGGKVTRVDISRIYHGGKDSSPEACQAVAEVLSEKVQCSRYDLLPVGWVPRSKSRSVKLLETPHETR